MSVKGVFLCIAMLLCIAVRAQYPNPLPCPNKGGPGSILGTVNNNVTVKNQFANRTPVPYAYVREADIMWEKWIWRTIDMREKMNQRFYYPLEPANHRASLINIIYCAIDEGKVKAYSSIDDEFAVPMTKEEVFRIGSGIDTIQIPDLNDPDILHDTVVYRKLNPKDILEYHVKEIWYFDRQRSEFLPRIIGISPVRYVYSEDGDFKGKQEMFWVYFPELRDVIATYQAYNRFNDVGPLSFDDVFIKRIFSSYIYKESNTFDRKIEDYAVGMDALWEAEKVKEGLRDFEGDLWDW